MLRDKLIVIAGRGILVQGPISLCKKLLAKAVVLNINLSYKARKHVDNMIEGQILTKSRI